MTATTATTAGTTTKETTMTTTRRTKSVQAFPYSSDRIEFEIEEEPGAEAHDRTIEVYRDGRYLGRIESYRGSIDRPAGRLRIPGRQRVLWSATTPDEICGAYGYTSQADAMRRLNSLI